MDPAQVGFLLSRLNEVGFPSSHQLMVGVLVSDKSLAGDELKPIWRGKYPEPATAGAIFDPDPRLLNIVHYNTKGQDAYLAEELERVCQLISSADGLQLNIAWPHP